MVSEPQVIHGTERPLCVHCEGVLRHMAIPDLDRGAWVGPENTDLCRARYDEWRANGRRYAPGLSFAHEPAVES